MTVKDVVKRTGLTHQAIYKRLKAKGVKLETIKNRETGQFTPDGERLIIELFNLENAPQKAEKQPENGNAEGVEKLRNQVAKLTTEVEKLRNQVETLTSERDYLRQTLEREQQLHALTLTKLLPSSEDGEKGRLRAAWDALRGRR